MADYFINIFPKLIVCVTIVSTLFGEGMMGDIPRSTVWTLEAESSTSRVILESIYRIYCTEILPNGIRIMGRPSTGFLLANGYLVTARHVVQGYAPSDIIALSAYNEKVTFERSILDTSGGRDIAILKPAVYRGGGLELIDDERLDVGEQIVTYGFPYLGNSASCENERTAPLLSMGYLSGYDDYAEDIDPIKYYIINGAVAIGNSGSPIFKYRDDKVAGMVIRKFAPFTLDMSPDLAAQDPGFIGDMLNLFNIVTPGMMYRAICASELKKLLSSKNMPL